MANDSRTELLELAKKIQYEADKARLSTVSEAAQKLQQEILNSIPEKSDKKGKIKVAYDQLIIASRNPKIRKELLKELIAKLIVEGFFHFLS